MKTIATFLAFSFLATISVAQAATSSLTPGQVLSLCPAGEQASITDLHHTDASWSAADIGYALRCKGDANIYLLTDPAEMYQPKVPATVHVKYVINSNTPAALFVPKRDAFTEQSLVITVRKNAYSWSDNDPEIVLYTDPNYDSSVCAKGQAELLMAQMKANDRDKNVSFAPAQALGACIDGSVVGNSLHPVNVLDYEMNYKTRTLTVAVFTNPKDNFNDSEGLEVVSVNFNSGKAKVLLDLQGKKYFPLTCGHYFKTARLLPNAPTKIAMFYAAPKIDIVDFTDSANVKVTEPFNGDDPDLGRTCEGYIPSYKSERNRISLSRPWNKKDMIFWYVEDIRTNQPTVAKVKY